jgi:ribose transport system substrate-binding protein
MPSIRIITAVAITSALLVLSGCGRHSTSEVYYLVSANLSLPYWKTAAAGFNQAAVHYNVTARVVGPESYDPQAELQALQQAVAAKPAGILISVADEALLKPEIDEAINGDIPVITMDSDAPSSHRLFFIGTNNLAAGQLGAERVVERLGGRGNVVFFTITGQPNLDDRLKGYKDVFEQHPEIKILDVVNIKGDSRNAFDNAMQYLSQTGPTKVSAFICLEASSGKVVADAVRRQHATDRVVIAMDVQPDTLSEIKDGIIDATIAQKPYTMAYVGLRELDMIYHDKPAEFARDYSVDAFAQYPVFIDTGAALVDKVNADMYARDAQEHQ